MIVSPPPLYVPENIGRASIQGLTLAAQTPPAHGLVANLGVTNLYRAQDLDTETRIPGRGPVFAVIAGLRYLTAPTSRFDGFTVQAATQGPQESPDPYLAPQYGAYQPATFTLIDAYAGYRITPALVLVARGYNLGNDRYALYAGYPMPGRAFSVELRSR